MILNRLLIITISIFLPIQSYALSPFYSFRYLYDEQSNDSPSPSPSHGVDLASGGLNFQDSCNGASRNCQMKDIASCLISSQNEIYLLVQNNGERPLHLKIMIIPTNNTIEDIDLQRHQIEKIKISSSDIDLSSTIALNSSIGDCVLHVAAPPPENNYQKYPSYHTYITPINGAYFGILVFIIGGTLTCFKLRLRGRHLDGVPYHELEMGNSTDVSSLDVEKDVMENWDEDWDDDEWGDEKEKVVEFGGEKNIILENGFATKLPNSNGRRKEWDD